MPYKNENETLTKCYRCGRFTNANDAWYDQQPDGTVEPLCRECSKNERLLADLDAHAKTNPAI